jgi:hypothetical protein
MPEVPEVRVLPVTQPVIDEACVARLATTARECEADGQATVGVAFDLSSAREITPRALAALLELGSSATVPHLALVGLSRPATLLAVQVGLAERFDIFVGGDALSSPAPTGGMRALIHEVDGLVGAGAFDVAGRPLLVRQLQWLRDLGIEDVFVEVCEGEQAAERASWLLGSDPLTSRVHVIPSAQPLGAAELAHRAGLHEDELFLALPAHLALHAKLDLQADSPTRYQIAPPTGCPGIPCALELRSRRRPAEDAPSVLSEGWGLEVKTHEDAHVLACTALEHRAPGLLVHASEVKPGVWVARGARVASDAQIAGPVLVGPDSRVMSGAKLGPRVVLGQATIIERDAQVADASVAAQTIVGEGTRIRAAHADAHGLTRFGDGTRNPVADPLVLAARAPVGTSWTSRMFALVLLVLLATPWLLGIGVRTLLGRPGVRALKTRAGRLHIGESGLGVVDLLPALFDVLMGHRDLVGINDRRALEAAFRDNPLEPMRAGALDLSSALAPGASTATLMRMWRWYGAHKNAALDRALLREGALGAGRKAE